MDSHSNELRYECSYCHKRFRGFKTCRVHELRHREANEPNKFNCSICGKLFKTRQTLKVRLGLSNTMHFVYIQFILVFLNVRTTKTSMPPSIGTSAHCARNGLSYANPAWLIYGFTIRITTAWKRSMRSSPMRFSILVSSSNTFTKLSNPLGRSCHRVFAS